MRLWEGKSYYLIDAIEVQKNWMPWAMCAAEMVVICDRSEVTVCSCRWCAMKVGQICEVQESKVPSCRQSRLVLGWVGC